MNKITAEIELSKSEARAVAYMIKATPALGVCLASAGIFSVMWIYAMANCATGIAYVVIGCCELMIIAGILAGVAAPSNTDEEKAQGLVMIVIGVICLVIFNGILYCKWRNIKIAIAVIDATADFFMKTPRINLVGGFYFFVSGVWFCIWVALVVGMLGIAKFKWAGEGTPTHQERTLITDDGDNSITYMIAFMFFTLIWVLVYLKESNVFVLMGSVSTYYFDSNANNEGEADVMLAMNWCHKVHMGSIALGSFVHTCILLIIWTLMAGEAAA